MKSFSFVPAAFALFAFAGCSRPQPASAVLSSLPPVKVQVVAVRVETIAVPTEITGVVHAADRALLAAKVMGAIDSVPVMVGQRVKRGDPVVIISAGEITARVAEAESQCHQAARELARERELLPKGASTATLVKDLEDRSAGCEAVLREAKVLLSYATVRAPFDGLITRKYAQAGDLASPGAPLVEIEGLNGFDVEAGIPDSLGADLRVGRSLGIQIAPDGAVVSGEISEISSAADFNAHTVPLKIAVPDGAAVHSGQFVRLMVPGKPVRALLVPGAAVTTVGQMERVFVAGADGRAVLRLVKTGARRGLQVEILSGLDDGDRVLLAPPAGLREGQLLDPQP